MDAEEIREIANNASGVDDDRIDADLKHIEIEIYENAKKGNYSLDYEFATLKTLANLTSLKIVYMLKGLK